jgi:hypothetical protein
MPYGEPHPEDPHELRGVTVPGDAESMREMAYTFAEEFAALGFDQERLLRIFRLPGYAGAHRAYRALGEIEIQRIVRESLELWGRCRIVVREPAPEQGSDDLIQIGSRSAGRSSRSED